MDCNSADGSGFFGRGLISAISPTGYRALLFPAVPLIDGPDCALNVEIHGTGDPVTVFAHGVTSSTAELAPLAARVSGTRLLLDFRGHGASESPPSAAGYDHAAMGRDLRFVADRYAATRAFGISMGAGALMGILAEEPGRFERVAFFIPASIDAPNAAAIEIFPREATQLETIPVHELATRSATAPTYLPLYMRRPYWRELVRARIVRMNGTGVPRALRAYIDGPPPVADAEALRRVRAPALVLSHEGDPIHDVAVARRLAGLLPCARLHLWSEPLAMYDDLDAFASLIGDFFNAGT